MNDFEQTIWRDLINRVLDGTANESERAQLQQILAESPQARALYLRYVNLHCTLRLMSGSFALPEENRPPVPVRPLVPSLSVRQWSMMLASLAALVLLAVWAFQGQNRVPAPHQPDLVQHDKKPDANQNAPASITLRILEVQGKLEVIGEDKTARAAGVGDEVQAGVTLQSGEDGTKAVVEVAGERFHLGADTSIRLVNNPSKPPQIFVVQGDVRVEPASSKKSSAYVLVTPHAEMHGKQCVTEIAVSLNATRVAVNEGTVQLIRRSDQQHLDIAEGTWVYASTDNDPMVPQRPERQAPENTLKTRADRVALAADGKTLGIFTGSKLEVWDLETRTLLKSFDPGRKRVTGLSFNPKGDWLIVGDRYPFVQVWDWRNERLVHTLESPQPDELAYRPVFSPDGSKLYCARHSGYFMGECGWNTASWQPLKVPTGKGRVKSFAHVPKTDLFAAGTGDGSLILWNSTTESQLEILRYGKASIHEICLSADGRLLAQAGPEGTVVWNLSTRKVLWHFEGNGHLAFSADGKVLAVATHGYLDFLNAETGQLRSTIRTEKDQMQWLHFAPDGQTLLALSGAKHRVVTWKIPSGPSY